MSGLNAVVVAEGGLTTAEQTVAKHRGRVRHSHHPYRAAQIVPVDRFRQTSVMLDAYDFAAFSEVDVARLSALGIREIYINQPVSLLARSLDDTLFSLDFLAVLKFATAYGLAVDWALDELRMQAAYLFFNYAPPSSDSLAVEDACIWASHYSYGKCVWTGPAAHMSISDRRFGDHHFTLPLSESESQAAQLLKLPQKISSLSAVSQVALAALEEAGYAYTHMGYAVFLPYSIAV